MYTQHWFSNLFVCGQRVHWARLVHLWDRGYVYQSNILDCKYILRMLFQIYGLGLHQVLRLRIDEERVYDQDFYLDHWFAVTLQHYCWRLHHTFCERLHFRRYRIHYEEPAHSRLHYDFYQWIDKSAQRTLYCCSPTLLRQGQRCQFKWRRIWWWQ